MRDLTNYVEAYKDHGFEAVQSSFRKRTVLNFLEKYKAKNILEVGTGFSPLFLDYNAYEQFTVVEPAEEFFQAAERLGRGLPNLNFFQGTIEEIAPRLKDNCFDAIVVSSLLHEVPHPELILQTVYLLMQENTVLHVNVPNANSFHRLLALEMGLIKSTSTLSETQIKLQQSSIFSEESFRNLLESAGFEIMDSGTLFLKPFTHSQMQQLLEAGILTASMLEGLEKMVKHAPGLGSELYLNVRRRPPA